MTIGNETISVEYDTINSFQLIVIQTKLFSWLWYNQYFSVDYDRHSSFLLIMIDTVVFSWLWYKQSILFRITAFTWASKNSDEIADRKTTRTRSVPGKKNSTSECRAGRSTARRTLRRRPWPWTTTSGFRPQQLKLSGIKWVTVTKPSPFKVI